MQPLKVAVNKKTHFSVGQGTWESLLQEYQQVALPYFSELFTGQKAHIKHCWLDIQTI